MIHKKTIFLVAFFVCFCLTIPNFPESQNNQKNQAWDGSRTTAVHRIQLKDEFDQLVIPTMSYCLPYSARYTCAPCHDYDLIKKGLHFDAAASSRQERPEEPWIWVDPKTGTVLPLSYHDEPGTWDPGELNLSDWDFTLLFGRHMTGGGVSEPGIEEVSPESRWNVSGKLEINCMGCHNASREQSHSEWAKQVLRQNFRWAATAASGMGEVGGMASRLPNTWDLFDGPNPDDSEWAVVPSVDYRLPLFDSKHRVFFDIAPRIEDQRCMACHSVSAVGETRQSVHGDVHSAAGIGCVDCHRNGIGHDMIRGYEGEAEDRQEKSLADFTCQGCHMNEDLSRRGGSASGRLGAPYPRHSGIPAVHFERLACTVCHSGPLPSKDLTRVRTSRANRLGIYGIAQWDTEWPHIVEPVFAKNHGGKIAPHRLIWPSYWGRTEGDKIVPLKPSMVQDAAGDILMVEEDTAQILKALALYTEIEGIPVLVLSGKVYEPNVDGLLDFSGEYTEKAGVEIFWGIRMDGRIDPLVPDFDPDAEMPDADAEIRIQNVLEALATIENRPGRPALLYKKAMYRVTEGYLEKLDSSQETVENVELIWVADEKPVPAVSGFQMRTVMATVGQEQTLTEEQVGMVLQSLARGIKSDDSLPDGERATDNIREETSDFIYVSGGRLFRLDREGNLSVSKSGAADPVLWPLGHRVRPAQQSLGINGCTDCHSESSSFFFARIEGDSPLITEKIETLSAHSLMELNKPYQKLFGLSFRIRPIFKLVLFVASLVVGFILLVMLIVIVGRYTGLIERRR
jgi:hypothetical protein